jgi:hypothetical protein
MITWRSSVYFILNELQFFDLLKGRNAVIEKKETFMHPFSYAATRKSLLAVIVRIDFISPGKFSPSTANWL